MTPNCRDKTHIKAAILLLTIPIIYLKAFLIYCIQKNYKHETVWRRYRLITVVSVDEKDVTLVTLSNVTPFSMGILKSVVSVHEWITITL